MRKLSLLLIVVTVALASAASAQQIDFGFGVGTISAPSASTAPTLNQPPVSLKGGAYPAFSGDVLFFKKHYGIGGNIAWRASEASPPGAQPYRPILWDIDGMWVPPLGKYAAAELSAGIGAESTRFYGTVNCNYFSCTNYVTSSHFLGQFGGGLKIYPHGGFYIKPEVHLYLVNNNVEYSSAHAVRYGATIGYTFGGQH